MSSFVRESIKKTLHPIFSKLFVLVTYGRGSLLLWERWNTLRYAPPVLSMTSRLYLIARNGRHK